MSDVTTLLNQFTARYQTALIVKAAVFGILSLDIAAACWWRLHRLGVSPWWSIGIPTLLTLAAASGLAWWLRARWISPRAAADQLDKTLGLQQRLVTTLEFAGTQPPPPLYSLLLDDTTQAFSTQTARVPRPVDRTTAALAVILLLLLLWPMKDIAPVRLANLPGVPPVTPPPQPETPPPPQDQQDQRSQEQQRQQQQQGQNQQDQQSQQDQRDQQGPQDQQDQKGQQGKQGQEGQQDQQGQQGQQNQQSQQRQQGQQGQEKQQGQQRQQGSQGQQGQQSQQGQQGQEGRQGNDSQAAQQQAASSSSGSGAQGLGNQDAVKADIQQLLKELSGELKDLQQQLAQADIQPPQAGTDTDPQLYGAPEPLDRAQGSSVPIQLKTDTADTKTPRPGGGVGKSSAEISSDGPTTKAEAAALAEESLEETAVTRQRVPPEYQSVFDRLYQRNPQPTEKSAQ